MFQGCLVQDGPPTQVKEIANSECLNKPENLLVLHDSSKLDEIFHSEHYQRARDLDDGKANSNGRWTGCRPDRITLVCPNSYYLLSRNRAPDTNGSMSYFFPEIDNGRRRRNT